MSYNNRDRDSKYTVPPRWLHCPRKSSLIDDKFLAFKTPLSNRYDDEVPEENRFTIDMLMESLKSAKINLGLWIDLTNTNRYYDKNDLEKYNIKYLKLQCRGHGETPSLEETKLFINVCKQFISQHPLQKIGVHCTHGFNRTGFLIIAYLVEVENFSVDAAVYEFAERRPTGIYKEDYMEELFRRYGDIADIIPVRRPAWCLEYDDSESQGGVDSCNEPASKKRRYEFQKKNPIFMSGVPGVSPVTDINKTSKIQKIVQGICKWTSSGFPGCQPVSMNIENIKLLHQKPYRVSWKADGTRYMMFIRETGEVYFIDRDNSTFQVEGVKFTQRRDGSSRLQDTLLDGEMVIDFDKATNKSQPRYLVYDIIMCNGRDVSQFSFFPDRYKKIKDEVIEGRVRGMKNGKINKNSEPFSIRQKEFWAIGQAKSLLGDKFSKQLGHPPDGLIFQPSKEPYVTGQCQDVLKWKPASLNSVDFKLKIHIEDGLGIVRRTVGHLYVGGHHVPFTQIKMTKTLKELDNKIIECKYGDNGWEFMRERTDKSFPNSFNTAQAVIASIKNPVTTEILLRYITKHGFVDDSEPEASNS